MATQTEEQTEPTVRPFELFPVRVQALQRLSPSFIRVTFAGDTLDQQGERYRFDAARTPDGWRLRRIEVTPIWRSA